MSRNHIRGSARCAMPTIDFTLDFVPQDAPHASVDPLIPDLGVAIQQLGLKLHQTKGQVDLLVIDHIDKAPTPN